MDIDTALLTRRTIHYWKALPISDVALDKALLAAHMAPCHRYTWPWRFNKVGSKARAALFELSVNLKKKGLQTLPERIHQNLIRKIIALSRFAINASDRYI